MKKLFVCLFVGVFIIVLCSSCGCKKQGKVSLQVGDMNSTSYTKITLEEVDSKVEYKENFILYVYKSDCGNCAMFKPILENAIRERHLTVYAIESKNITSGHELRSLKYVPSIVLYEKGKIVFKTDPVKNEDYFSNNLNFLSFLDKYTYMPTLYYINKAQLDEKISNNENFIIYYSRSSCTDCSYLNDNFLREYLNKNINSKHFYIIETDVEGIRYFNGSSPSNLDEASEDEIRAAQQWQSFKDDYGLSNINNILGHGVGYVPTFQYYENGEIKEMMVYFNDCEYIKNEDNSYSVIINNSYYEDNPYNGQTISYSEYKDKLSPFYNSKLKSFLDSNLEKVN